MSVRTAYHCTTLVKALRLWWKLRAHYASIKPCHGRSGWVVATVTGPSVETLSAYHGTAEVRRD